VPTCSSTAAGDGLGCGLRAGVQRARAERIFKFADTARDVYVLRASGHFRLQGELYSATV
jgi:hypothetical protein